MHAAHGCKVTTIKITHILNQFPRTEQGSILHVFNTLRSAIISEENQHTLAAASDSSDSMPRSSSRSSSMISASSSSGSVE